jgi:hypothetical protein
MITTLTTDAVAAWRAPIDTKNYKGTLVIFGGGENIDNHQVIEGGQVQLPVWRGLRQK